MRKRPQPLGPDGQLSTDPAGTSRDLIALCSKASNVTVHRIVLGFSRVHVPITVKEGCSEF